MKWFLPACLIFLAGCAEMSSDAPPVERTTITVQADQPGAKVSPTMWGAFFEDINFGGDGGLYAEMVKNRGFEFPDPMIGWIKIIPSLARGDISIQTESPYRPSQTHYVRVVSQASAAMGISNEGFRGMGVKAGEAYDFSAQIRHVEGSSNVVVQIVGADGTTLASAPLSGLNSDWSKITATLHPIDTDAHARLAIFLNGPGTVDFDFISLFPDKTWKNRPQGLRADMVQALADMHPGFLRFPGGCIVEGSDLSKRYQWKNTIGPIDDRKLLVDRWNYEFSWRPTPDYYQSFGLGFYEFFQLCEDIGSQPLPIVNAGMACQFNSGQLCPVDELGPYIQDALDLIEFANGPATSTWGAKRAAMGHPEPFNPPLRMLGVGNEQWGPQYLERLAKFTAAIKAKYPEISLVSDAGPSPDDDRFAYLWPKLQQFKVDGHAADIVDQHCYANPIWFLANSTRFDKYDRNGPKVFFGEYAAQSVAICSTKNRNNLECALSEAAYMNGMERNADVVHMASYAPLFSNVDAWQWTPDLIWADSLHAVPSMNYYVQQLYCQNRGDAVLPTSNTSAVRDLPPAGRVGIGTSNCTAEFSDLTITKTDGDALPANTSGNSWQSAGSDTKYFGDKAWSDYTVTLKARRTEGSGAIVVNVCDDETPAMASRAQWILGAPVGGPTVADPTKPEFVLQTHFAEQDQLLAHTPGSLEIGRWYDIKISVHGNQMDCYLDGRLLQSSTILDRKVPALFTSATRDDASGEIILKVVNPGAASEQATINLSGIKNVEPVGKVITLTGNNADEDSLETPTRDVPSAGIVAGVAPEFSYLFKPHSMTVLRLAAR
jgi:alpha-L-arabinofuranosidase